jgi:transcriptional regulator with XRE-family HTH domain
MPEEETSTDLFRERLKSARELRGYSQEELAKRARMPPSSIAHFETGRKPSFDSLKRIAIALEITTDYLLGRVDSPELAQGGDPLYRDVAKLTGHDREIAKDFLEMLARRNSRKDTNP